MINKITFSIDGQPVGKERPRYSEKNVYTPEKTVAYTKKIKEIAHAEMRRKNIFVTKKPCVVKIEAVYLIPKSWSKKNVISARFDSIKPSKPDIDNVIKIILDGCNKVVFHDDVQVHSITSSKRFVTFDEIEHVQVSVAWDE